jgi:hypothetical protein
MAIWHVARMPVSGTAATKPVMRCRCSSARPRAPPGSPSRWRQGLRARQRRLRVVLSPGSSRSAVAHVGPRLGLDDEGIDVQLEAAGRRKHATTPPPTGGSRRCSDRQASSVSRAAAAVDGRDDERAEYEMIQAREAQEARRQDAGAPRSTAHGLTKAGAARRRRSGHAERPCGTLDPTRYKAFISYSHTQRELARALQDALHRFGVPWYEQSGPRIFRDESGLAAGPDSGRSCARHWRSRSSSSTSPRPRPRTPTTRARKSSTGSSGAVRPGSSSRSLVPAVPRQRSRPGCCRSRRGRECRTRRSGHSLRALGWRPSSGRSGGRSRRHRFCGACMLHPFAGLTGKSGVLGQGAVGNPDAPYPESACRRPRLRSLKRSKTIVAS